MRRSSGVGVILLLALGFLATPVFAQNTGAGASGARDGVGLSNYPNPFNPETRITFCLEDELFQGDRPVRVTIQIYNVLLQQVAVPVALYYEGGPNRPMTALEYTSPGCFEAYWDGRDMRNGQEVPSAVYHMRLVVEGSTGRAVTRMRPMQVVK
jgi:hypothetical protein